MARRGGLAREGIEGERWLANRGQVADDGCRPEPHPTMTSPRGHIELPAIGILKHLEAGERERLSDAGYSLRVKRGEEIVSQGARQDSLYILIEGGLIVSHEKRGEEIEIGRIEPGESFGEMAMMDPAKASANVRATADSLIWRVRRTDLDGFILRNPDAGLRMVWDISALVIRRLRERTDELAELAEEFGELKEKLRPIW